MLPLPEAMPQLAANLAHAAPDEGAVEGTTLGGNGS